jgi:hypothetical protein
MFRLLAELWTIPGVEKIGLLNEGFGPEVWVLLADRDNTASSRVYAAERDYLNSTPFHNFKLRVTALSKVRTELLPPIEMILER